MKNLLMWISAKLQDWGSALFNYAYEGSDEQAWFIWRFSDEYSLDLLNERERTLMLIRGGLLAPPAKPQVAGLLSPAEAAEVVAARRAIRCKPAEIPSLLPHGLIQTPAQTLTN